MVGTANNVGNAQIDVVGDHTQVVGGTSVGAQQDKILQLRIPKLDFAEYRVFEYRAPGFRDGKAHGRRFARIFSPQSLAAIHASARALVAGWPAFGSRFGAPRLQ